MSLIFTKGYDTCHWVCWGNKWVQWLGPWWSIFLILLQLELPKKREWKVKKNRGQCEEWVGGMQLLEHRLWGSIFFIITNTFAFIQLKPESDKCFQPFMEMEKLLFQFLGGKKTKGKGKKGETQDSLPLSCLSSHPTFHHCFTAWIITHLIYRISYTIQEVTTEKNH